VKDGGWKNGIAIVCLKTGRDGIPFPLPATLWHGAAMDGQAGISTAVAAGETDERAWRGAASPQRLHL